MKAFSSGRTVPHTSAIDTIAIANTTGPNERSLARMTD
jgi:hypothetical protein